MARPYGAGAYGVGKYSRDGAMVHILSGRADIAFDATAARPGWTVGLTAVSGIVFDATTPRPALVMAPGASGGITFEAVLRGFGLTLSVGAASGIVFDAMIGNIIIRRWAAPDVCHAGTWTVVDLARAA